MARPSGVSGLAVGLATAGGLLMLSAIRNRSIADVLRDVVGKRTLGSSGAETGPAIGSVRTAVDAAAEQTIGDVGAETGIGNISGSTIGMKAARVAQSQMGKPYVFGAAGPNSFDCSGLVSFCLQQAGLNVSRMVTTQFMVWGGAITVGRDSCVAGDLVCWPGHIGIATSRDTMIHAPSAGDVVKESRIWETPPPTIRRVKEPPNA